MFIPWDKDTSFSSPGFALFARVDENVLALKLLNDATQKRRYQDLVKKTVTDVLNSTVLGPKMEAAYTQIREAVLADTKKPYSNDAFELSVTGLRGIIAGRQADVLAQLQYPGSGPTGRDARVGWRLERAVPGSGPASAAVSARAVRARDGVRRLRRRDPKKGST